MGTSAEMTETADAELRTTDVPDACACELLIAIAGPRSGPAAERIRAAATNVRDWESVSRLADEHRVSSLLFLRLQELGVQVPAAAQERLRADHHRNVFHCIANSAELIGMLEAFDREGIPAMPFKGVVLGVSVYGDMTARPAGDLDVLIRHSDLARATELLLGRGYTLTTELKEEGGALPQKGGYEYHFQRDSDGSVVELRWQLELAYGRYVREIGIDWACKDGDYATLAGSRVPDMGAEAKLIMLCMHGTKHAWSRLIWIRDVAELLAARPEMDWSKVFREATRLGLWRPLALGILLANRVAKQKVPAAVLKRFESDAAAIKLSRHVEMHLFDDPGSTPAGRIPYYLYVLSLRDRLRLLLSFDFFKPNERDVAAFPLPKPLHGLYFLIRPFRILMDRSAR